MYPLTSLHPSLSPLAQVLHPLLESASLPSARKEPSADQPAAAHGILEPHESAIDRLRAMASRTEKTQAKLHEELSLGTPEVSRRASAAKPPAAKRAPAAAAVAGAAPKRARSRAPAQPHAAGHQLIGMMPPHQAGVPPHLVAMPHQAGMMPQYLVPGQPPPGHPRHAQPLLAQSGHGMVGGVVLAPFADCGGVVRAAVSAKPVQAMVHAARPVVAAVAGAVHAGPVQATAVQSAVANAAKTVANAAAAAAATAAAATAAADAEAEPPRAAAVDAASLCDDPP